MKIEKKSPVLIYWCQKDNGEKFCFLSRANVRLGATVYDNDGSPATIIDIDEEKSKMEQDYLNFKYELMRAQSM